MARIHKAAAPVMVIAAFHLAAHPSMAQQRCNPLAVANAFMARDYPLFDLAGLRPVMADLGNIWALTYRLPPGYYGTTPTVIIEKRSCAAISMQYK